MRWLALVLLAVALGGCASVSDNAQRDSLAALDTKEPKARSGLSDLDATPACEKHEYRSLAPMGRMPRPGHMPPGTLMHDIQKRGYLIAGIDQNTLGLGYFDPIKKRNVGFDIELVKAVARAIFGTVSKKNLHYIAISTGQREPAVFYDDVDIVASAFSVTCERRRRLAFSTVYYRARQRLLVPNGSRVRGLEDLQSQWVCATKGSTSIKRLAHTGVRPYGVVLRSDCLVALQEGQVAAVTADDAILLGFSRQDPQTQIVGRCLALERYGMAMSKQHPEFVRFVNAVLAKLRGGELQRLRRRYLRGLKTPPGGGSRAACERRP